MQQKLRHIPYYGAVLLLIYMPFHVLLSQSLSLLTGGLAAWKLGKDIVTFCLVALTVSITFALRKHNRLYVWLTGLTLGYALLHIVIYLLNRNTSMQVAVLATTYNVRVFGFLLIGMGVALLTPKKIQPAHLIKLVIIVSTIVCILGILQYFLPQDLLTHFGYSVERGVKPYFYIDTNPDLGRITSTLRDPNSLGAYLVVPTTLLLSKLAASLKKRKESMVWGSLFALHLIAILLTYSRSALIGTIIALGLYVCLAQKRWVLAQIKRFWVPLIGLLVISSFALFLLRNQYVVRHAILHTDDPQASQQDVNDRHAAFIQKGVETIIDKPLGKGPGTAGPVSVHNGDNALITENYFIQIAIETGMLGLLLFIYINYIVYRQLSRERHQSLSTSLVATFWAYLFINMFLHAWANEAVAVQWWLLAGVALISHRTPKPKRV